MIGHENREAGLLRLAARGVAELPRALRPGEIEAVGRERLHDTGTRDAEHRRVIRLEVLDQRVMDSTDDFTGLALL